MSRLLLIGCIVIPALMAAPTAAQPPPEREALIGRWQQDNCDGHVRFSEDGSFRIKLYKDAQYDGTFRILDRDTIEATVLIDRKKVTNQHKYTLKEGVLKLKIGQHWVAFQKPKKTT